MIQLDEYYNGLEEINKRKYSYTHKPKSFGQSLKDIFFPNVRNKNRKLVKVKKPHLNFVSSTVKPIIETMATLRETFHLKETYRLIDIVERIPRC